MQPRSGSTVHSLLLHQVLVNQPGKCEPTQTHARGHSLLLSMYADVRKSDDVVAFFRPTGYLDPTSLGGAGAWCFCEPGGSVLEGHWDYCTSDMYVGGRKLNRTRHTPTPRSVFCSQSYCEKEKHVLRSKHAMSGLHVEFKV